MDASSAYFTEDDQPTPRLSVVAYVDVLGFKEEMLAAQRAGTSDVLLRRFATVVREWCRSMRD
jgi:hypothetical protein